MSKISANHINMLYTINAGLDHAGHLFGVPVADLCAATLSDLVSLGMVRIQVYGRGEKASHRAIITNAGRSAGPYARCWK